MRKLVLVAGLCASLIGLAGASRAASENGSAGDMPAFYDDQLFTINFKELPLAGEAAVLANNRSINVIYMSDDCMPNGEMFVSVIDAIQGDGFNPLWQEVQVVFNNLKCQQLTSDEDIVALADMGLITLVPTDEVYRCSVVGPKQ